jgi:hypothetical protein
MKKAFILVIISVISNLHLECFSFFNQKKTIQDLQKTYNARIPDKAINDIAQQALKDCDIKHEVIILQSDDIDNSFAGYDDLSFKRFMILGTKNLTVEQITAAAYHECGHLHFDCSEKIIKRAQRVSTCANTVGLPALAETLHKQTSKHFAQRGPFITAAVGLLGLASAKLYTLMQNNRLKEFRADSFAYQRLLQAQRAEVVITDVAEHIKEFEKTGCTERTSTVFDEYPSSFERAQNGIDILKQSGALPNYNAISALLAKYFPKQ